MKADRGPAEAGGLEGAADAVVLGSGLGDACGMFPVEASIAFADVPGVTATGVRGHLGMVERRRVAGQPCLFVRGRKHAYERAISELEALIEFMERLGVRRLLSTSACGSLSAHLPPGQFVLITDVIDLQPRSVPVHLGVERPGTRAGLALCPVLGERLQRAAASARIPLARGVMATCLGPTYETPAEVRALRSMGADIVSMSGAPEMATANRLGIQVASVALVTNWATGISRVALGHGEVLEHGRDASAGLGRLIEQVLGDA